MNYPTVYNPGYHGHVMADSSTFQRYFKKAGELVKDGDVVWDDATGSGIVAWLVYQASKNKASVGRLASDLNALAVANALHLADEAGFELETAVSDTTERKFPFGDVQVKLATSNSPAIFLASPVRMSGPAFHWDDDVGGAYAQGFASIIAKALLPNGLAMSWNALPTPRTALSSCFKASAISRSALPASSLREMGPSR